ncbi:hypothetical protein AB0O82_32650 [Kitasatospora sp. NPDC088264]|uniref:hypothetical protein n=1 Tax=Kitasatospora sp. NPDC088264 TaxID=3155296 RepID=UPI00341E7C90
MTDHQQRPVADSVATDMDLLLRFARERQARVVHRTPAQAAPARDPQPSRPASST